MTQMLLFDSPATESAVVPPHPSTVTSRALKTAQTAADLRNVPARPKHDHGLHHMGDLARLVLLRYELVAKRRARIVAREGNSPSPR